MSAEPFGPGSHLLVTGGAGFIGSCFVRDVLARDDGTQLTVLDKLTYAGNEANLRPALDQPGQAARLRFVRGDIADPEVVGPLVADADAVLNFAAESHVDRSILDPEAFLRTGVIGVHVLLDACRREAARLASGERRTPAGDPRPAPRYLQVSTDEVYGSVETGESVESDPLAPRSPYAASKAAGELLVRSYVVTHGIDALVTRGSNTYGPYHHPEKLIPLFITNALEDQPLPLYGDGLQQRDWLYVSDHAGAIDWVLRHGRSGETYNIPGSAAMTNRAVVALLLEILDKPWSLVRTVEDRPGHDRRYALDGTRLAALGWRNKVEFADGLRRTVDWFRANEAWWRAIKAGDWDAYYERQYGRRLAGSEPASLDPAGSSAATAYPAGATAAD
jgi:dTDP-glucose 4,6-dehydratase